MNTQHAKRSIPDRGHMIHGYLLKSKAKNAIKLSCHKDKPRLLGCLCKDLHTWAKMESLEDYAAHIEPVMIFSTRKQLCRKNGIHTHHSLTIFCKNWNNTHIVHVEQSTYLGFHSEVAKSNIVLAEKTLSGPSSVPYCKSSAWESINHESTSSSVSSTEQDVHKEPSTYVQLD
jgi:hypothetical protein